MDYFRESDPRNTPRHLFRSALRLDFDNAVRADITRQNYSVCPRYWYIDAEFRCVACDDVFLWSVDEQRIWFEQYQFWIDSAPIRCQPCRSKERSLKALRQEYDRLVGSARDGGSIEQKKRVVAIIEQLQKGLAPIPEGVLETKNVFWGQIQKAAEKSRRSDPLP